MADDALPLKSLEEGSNTQDWIPDPPLQGPRSVTGRAGYTRGATERCMCAGQ